MQLLFEIFKDQAPQWGKKAKTGWNRKNIDERSHPFPFPDYFSAHFARRFVFANADFFSFFPLCGAWSQATLNGSGHSTVLVLRTKPQVTSHSTFLIWHLQDVPLKEPQGRKTNTNNNNKTVRLWPLQSLTNCGRFARKRLLGFTSIRQAPDSPDDTWHTTLYKMVNLLLRDVVLVNLGFHMCSHCLSMLVPFFQANETTNAHQQEHITRSEQLPCACVTAFSRISLFLEPPVLARILNIF